MKGFTSLVNRDFASALNVKRADAAATPAVPKREYTELGVMGLETPQKARPSSSALKSRCKSSQEEELRKMKEPPTVMTESLEREYEGKFTVPQESRALSLTSSGVR